MDLEQELEAILSGAKDLGGELLTKLINATGNPTLSKVLFDLIGSHVSVAKQVQQTPPGQAALQALKAKQAAAQAAAAPAAQAAPAAAAQADAKVDALAAALGGIAAALARIDAKLDTQAGEAKPEGPTAPPVVG